MLKVDQVHVIRHKVLAEGQSARRVAREMGISRNTVKRYLALAEPRRREPERRARPVLEGVQGRLEELLEDWRGRTTAKQAITATRLHQALLEEGYSVGITLVRGYLREKRRAAAEVYIPLVHRPGDSAQVDFFEVSVELDGARCKAWKFLMRLMYSGRDFVWIYERCDQLSFLDAHVRAFEYFGAVPQRCVYDNLTPAVKRVMKSQRVLQERFAALVSHYLFEPCFARVGVGHDKGGVEGRGRGVRLQHLVPVPSGKSLGELSEQLLRDVERAAARKLDEQGRSVPERFEQERPCMRPLPAVPFEARRTLLVEVSSRSQVKLEGGWYSVPSHWARLEATAHIGVLDVRVSCRGETLTYPKVPFGGRRVEYRHYLPELAKKPQAVRQVAPELLAELGEPYQRLWDLLLQSHGPREAARVLARVLGAIVVHGEPAVSEALLAALSAERMDLLALAPRLAERPLEVAVPSSLAGYEIESASVARYDSLLLGGADHE